MCGRILFTNFGNVALETSTTLVEIISQFDIKSEMGTR